MDMQNMYGKIGTLNERCDAIEVYLMFSDDIDQLTSDEEEPNENTNSLKEHTGGMLCRST